MSHAQNTEAELDGARAPLRGRRRRSKRRCFRCGAGWNGRGTHACVQGSEEPQKASSLEQMRSHLLSLRRDASGLVSSSAEAWATAALQAVVDVLNDAVQRPLPTDA